MNAFVLKLIALIFMVADNLFLAIPDLLPWWTHAATRWVAPLFAFFVVEGFQKTSNRRAYFTRLAGMAALMAAVNLMLNRYLFLTRPLHDNIFLTLALGFLLLICVEQVSVRSAWLQKLGFALAALGLLVLGFFIAEGGTVVLPFMLITWLLRGRTAWRNLAYLALAGLLFLMNYQPYGNFNDTIRMLAYNSDFLLITVLPFIYLYNGQRGPSNWFTKNFFYAFYPLSLWITYAFANGLLN